MDARRASVVPRWALGALLLAGCGGGGGGGSANVEPIGPGRIDPDFGLEGGSRVYNTNGGSFTGVVTQPDGRIVVVGTWVVSDTNTDFGVFRFLEDGSSLDPSFGSGGPFSTADFGGIDEPFGVVLRPSDGAIIVVGRTDAVGGGAIAIASFTSSGAPDVALDPTGRKVIDVTTSDDEARAVAIQIDEDVVIAANSGVSTGTSNFLLYRMSPNGTISIGADTVNGTGPSTATWGNDDRVDAIALDPITGDIVLAGTSDGGAGPGNDFAVARFLGTTGHLDPSFDEDGQVLVDIDTDDRGTAVQVDTVGRTLVSGYTLDGPTFSITAVRLNQVGAVDTSWNPAPTLPVSFPHNGSGFFQHHLQGGPGAWSNDGAFCSFLQPDGSLVIAGNSAPGSNPFALDPAILRLDPQGHLDPTFGTLPFGGNVFAFPGTGSFDAITQDSLGRLVLAGRRTTGTTVVGLIARVGG
jgi:uncharacterized delta-60 repeat protein